MPIYRDVDDSDTLGHVERCRRDYDATKNPLYAWEALGAWYAAPSISGARPMPIWLRRYLQRTSNRLLGVATTGRLTGRDSAARALGLRGGLDAARKDWGGPFDASEVLAQRVVDLMWKDGLALSAAAEALDGKGTSRSRAIEAVRRAKRYALRTMEDRLEAAGVALPEPRRVYITYSEACGRREPPPTSQKPDI